MSRMMTKKTILSESSKRQNFELSDVLGTTFKYVLSIKNLAPNNGGLSKAVITLGSGHTSH